MKTVTTLLVAMAQKLGGIVEFSVHRVCNVRLFIEGEGVVGHLLFADEDDVIYLTQMAGKRIGRKVRIGTVEEVEEMVKLGRTMPTLQEVQPIRS